MTYTNRARRISQEGDEDFCISSRPARTRESEIAATRVIIASIQAEIDRLATVTTYDTTDRLARERAKIATWERGL